MNKATLNRTLRKRALSSGPFVVTQSVSINQSSIPSQKLVENSTVVKKNFEQDLRGAKLASDTGDHKLALMIYLALLHVSSQVTLGNTTHVESVKDGSDNSIRFRELRVVVLR